MSTTRSLANLARQWLARGCHPIPHKGKRPVVDGWNTVLVTNDLIAEWDSRDLWQNIGIRTGVAPTNWVAVDFDGLPIYDAFCATFPNLAQTMRVRTGGGNGMHVHFRCDLLPENIQIMGILIGGEKCNIEIKAEGKSIIMPPSIHPETGNVYEWANAVAPLQVTDLAAFVAWAKTFDRKPMEVHTESTRTLNQRLVDAVAAHFRSLPHHEHKGWINCCCPKHHETQPSFGFNPTTGMGKCFVCGSIPLKELAPLVGIDIDQMGGLFERIEIRQAPLDRRPALPAGQVVQGTAKPVRQNLVNITYRPEYVTAVDQCPVIPPIPLPLEPLWQYGGMMTVLPAGKIFGIIGVSGGGKTHLIEKMIDKWQEVNIPTIIWSPEWSWGELYARRAKRLGGPSVTALAMHELATYETQRFGNVIRGRFLSDIERKSMEVANKVMETRTSSIYALEAPKMGLNTLHNELSLAMSSITGERPRVLIIDYYQLFEGNTGNVNLKATDILNTIKIIAAQHGLLVVVTMQVTKESAKNQSEGKMLSALSARGINPDTFGGLITINPEYDEVGNMYPHLILNVVKNSDGRKGMVRVGMNWETGVMSDMIHHNQNFKQKGLIF